MPSAVRHSKGQPIAAGWLADGNRVERNLFVVIHIEQNRQIAVEKASQVEAAESGGGGCQAREA